MKNFCIIFVRIILQNKFQLVPQINKNLVCAQHDIVHIYMLIAYIIIIISEKMKIFLKDFYGFFLAKIKINIHLFQTFYIFGI